MKENKKQKGLLNEFNVPEYGQWLELVEKQLKGAPFEKKLISQTAEGIPIQPIYRQVDNQDILALSNLPGSFPYTRGTQASGSTVDGWGVAQQYAYPDSSQFNESISHDISRGLKTLFLVLDEAVKTGIDPDNAKKGDIGRNGLSVFCLQDLEKAFEGVNLSDLTLLINAGTSASSFISILAAYQKSKKLPLDTLKGSIIFDPVSELAVCGKLNRSLSDLQDEMAGLVRWTVKNSPDLRAIGIDGRPYRESGGSAVQELAFSVATGVEYIREMLNRGIDIDDAAGNISFFFSIGSDFFMEISKLRAARVLWAKIVAAFGGNEISQKIKTHANSTQWNKTVHDPYVNLLRATTEAYSGVIGGCDSLDIAPFDAVMGLPNEISRRISRNIQAVLKEECHGNKVIDPAGGSWFVEKLTDELAEKSWILFQEIEKAGGMVDSLKKGIVQQKIEETSNARLENVALRKDVIVGTNMYPSLDEEMLPSRQPDYETLFKNRSEEAKNYKSQRTEDSGLSQIDRTKISSDTVLNSLIGSAMKGATIGELASALKIDKSEKISVSPLMIRRNSDEYEKMRANALAYKEANGTFPTVFLANMGPVSQHKARADFSTGFLQPGGFSVISNDGFEKVEDAVDAAVASKAKIFVICATDKTYPDLVPAFTKAVKKANPDVIVAIAGYPKEHVETFQKTGVDEFIHIKANNLRILKKFQEIIGV